MAKAEWTYQVAPAGAPTAGLEEYVVEASSGEHVGTVVALLDRRGERFIVVECGDPPVRHDVRAVPWADVAGVDHDSLTVRLQLSEAAVADALELDPAKGVEDGDADARRVTELPPELRRPGPTGDAAGPVDRAAIGGALGLGAAGLLALLSVVLVAQAVDGSWKFALFAVPALLLAAAGIVAYRVYRDPTVRR